MVIVGESNVQPAALFKQTNRSLQVTIFKYYVQSARKNSAPKMGKIFNAL